MESITRNKLETLTYSANDIYLTIKYALDNNLITAEEVENLRHTISETVKMLDDYFHKELKTQKEKALAAGFFKWAEDLDEAAVIDEKVADVYDSYLESCIEYPMLSKIKFSQMLALKYNVKSKVKSEGGKSVRVYQKVTDDYRKITDA